MASVQSPNLFSSSAEGDLPPDDILFGSSDLAQALRRKVEKVAAANVPVLITGESGTGKELLARYIHYRSPWREGPFLKVNCPAIPGTLLESELFGYEKGAFTGANGSKPGRVELASGGTLFLDEIGEMDPSIQAKLLQVLQDGQFSRIGSQEDTHSDVRVISASNRVLQDEIRAGNFRQDLFFRINVVHIELLPLRERLADVPVIARYFSVCYQKKYGRTVPPLSPHVLGLMQKSRWQGNIRELENLIKRYVILGTEDAITGELFGRGESEWNLQMQIDGTLSLKELTRRAARELELKVILKVLEANNWNRRRSAKALSISYRALIYKIRQAGLPSKRMGLTPLPARAKQTAGSLDGMADPTLPGD